MVKEMEKKRILPATEAAGSRQHALMREEAGRKPFVGSYGIGSKALGGRAARREKNQHAADFFP